jgi:hypothetical protein
MRGEGFTPGPWVPRRAKFPSDGGIDYGIEVVVDGRKLCIAEAFEVVHFDTRMPAEANARLIAAAPEMFEALRDLLIFYAGKHDGIEREQLRADFSGPDGIIDEGAFKELVWNNARAALRKATGGE